MKLIITGASGMVGEGVLLECLAHPAVEQVLVLGRRPCGVAHGKLREILVADFFDLAAMAGEFVGYDACFFCLGVSSRGRCGVAYRHVTYELTLSVARVLAGVSPDMGFCYVTGAGTDSTEQGRVAWARVKGATENALLGLFRNGYMFRPGALKASAGQRHLKLVYKMFAWVYPVGRAVYPRGFCTLRELGLAMIHAVERKHARHVLEVPDIVALAGG